MLLAKVYILHMQGHIMYLAFQCRPRSILSRIRAKMIPIIEEPCQKLSAVPVVIISLPVTIRINHLWFIVHDQLK